VTRQARSYFRCSYCPFIRVAGLNALRVLQHFVAIAAGNVIMVIRLFNYIHLLFSLFVCITAAIAHLEFIHVIFDIGGKFNTAFITFESSHLFALFDNG